MATFLAHSASPPPPRRTPAGLRASSRHASIARRTTSVHGPLAWVYHEFVFIDQSKFRQRHRELHACCEQSLARLPLELLNGLPQVPAHELCVPVDRSRVLDTTYFLAASIVRAKGSIQSGLAPDRTGDRHAASIISYVTRPNRRASARTIGDRGNRLIAPRTPLRPFVSTVMEGTRRPLRHTQRHLRLLRRRRPSPRRPEPR
jgi:hypothetical protein